MTTLYAIKIYLSLSKTLQRLFQKNQSFGRASAYHKFFVIGKRLPRSAFCPTFLLLSWNSLINIDPPPSDKKDMTRPYPLLMLLFSLLLIYPLLGAFAETGQASWYGGKFQGRKTASGEIFDTEKLTAAHKTLAFDTLVEVTNLNNNRKVVVRINDRGPFIEGRIIDLSRAAAEVLDMVGTGVARVSVKVVEPPAQKKLGHRRVPEDRTVILQIGSYGVLSNARKIQNALIREGLEAQLELAGNGITRVILSSVPQSKLDEVLRKLSRLGYPSPLIRRRQ